MSTLYAIEKRDAGTNRVKWIRVRDELGHDVLFESKDAANDRIVAANAGGDFTRYRAVPVNVD